jgi:hypothetical protein
MGIELGVEMLDVGFDGVDRHVEFAGDFLVGEVGGEVAQDPEFARAEWFGQTLRLVTRRCALRARQSVQDLEDQGAVGCVKPGVAFEQVRDGVKQER